MVYGDCYPLLVIPTRTKYTGCYSEVWLGCRIFLEVSVLATNCFGVLFLDHFVFGYGCMAAEVYPSCWIACVCVVLKAMLYEHFNLFVLLRLVSEIFLRQNHKNINWDYLYTFNEFAIKFPIKSLLAINWAFFSEFLSTLKCT